MKKILLIILLFISPNKLLAQQEVIGIITLAIGDIKTSENRILVSGDPVYFNETIIASENSKSQIVLLDETVMMIGAGTELTIDEFIYNPENLNGKITTNIKQGSIKILSGKISETNPEDLIVKTPAGTIGTRGTEFQALVDEEEGESKILLIGPGPNNSLGLRPGEVEVFNEFGSVILDQPFLFTQFNQNQAPQEPIVISEQDFNDFVRVLEARNEISEDEEIQEAVKEGLLISGKESGSELVAEVIDIALKKEDGGVTAEVLSNALGVSVRDLFGDEYKKELDNETEENQIIIANGEFGDAIAMISRYGGTDKGSSSYADLAGKSSGTYTYTANGINGAASLGAGSGTINSTVVIDFAAQTITQSVSGTVALGSDASRTFSTISKEHNISSSSSDVENDQNVMIASDGTAVADNTDFGGDTPQAADSDNKTRFVSSGTNSYFLNNEFTASNIELGSGINNDPIAFAGHMNLVVENIDSDTNVENRVSFSRVGITPKKD